MFVHKKPRIENFYEAMALVCTVTFILIYIIENPSVIKGLTLAYDSSFLAPLFLLFIISIAMCEKHLSRFLTAKPMLLLGDSSYALYILQAPIWIIFERYLSPKLELSPLSNFCVYFLCLLLVSISSFLLLEKPLNNFLRFYLPKQLKAFSKSYTETPSVLNLINHERNIPK